MSNNNNPTDTDYMFELIANPSKLSIPVSNINSISSNDKPLSDKSIKSIKSIKSNNSNNSIKSNSIKSNISNNSVNTIKSNISRSKEINVPTSKNENTRIIPKNITEPALRTEPPQNVNFLKIDFLKKLNELKIKGYTLSKDYNLNSSLEEMDYEYNLIRTYIDKKNGTALFKNSLLHFTSVIEFLNDKYDPFDFHLSGWNEHLTKEIDSWEDVLEELYEKYKHMGKKVAPEIRLVYMIIMSGCAFHFTKSFMNPSNISSILSKPELLTGLFNNLNKPTINSSQKVNDLLKTLM